MVDLMGLLSDALIGSFQMLMLNDLGKNMFPYVMENLKGLLTDNGSMVILEETRTSYILLTSMEFKDGLTGFTDERAENEQTFFTRNQWESVFASHKGEIVFEFPSNESKLDLSGQTIYVTRFVNELEPIRKHDVRMYFS